MIRSAEYRSSKEFRLGRRDVLRGGSAISFGSKDNREDGEAQWKLYYDKEPFAVDLVLGEERVCYMQDLNVSLGMEKRVLPYEQVCDMSLARDAVKLLG